MEKKDQDTPFGKEGRKPDRTERGRDERGLEKKKRLTTYMGVGGGLFSGSERGLGRGRPFVPITWTKANEEEGSTVENRTSNDLTYTLGTKKGENEMREVGVW